MLICVMLKLKGSDGSILKEIWDREKPYSTSCKVFVSWESTSYDIKTLSAGTAVRRKGNFCGAPGRSVSINQTRGRLMKMNGARILVEELIHQGVEVIFGYPGGAS